ncbi:hypothetical protein ACFYE9_36150 [Rhizobium leguminosarum]|uniref:Uncharacterized protein n=1 Tax=Rhizobium leguminosarum TaxID=384 RepID=A0ACD5FCI6_RHILE|nr:hypothetical protein [Rhizobium leguminosarum]
MNEPPTAAFDETGRAGKWAESGVIEQNKKMAHSILRNRLDA